MKISKFGEPLWLLFLFSFVISLSVSSAENDHLDSGWLKLMRYRKTFLGNYISQADTPQYFLAKNGKTHPKEELEKTLVFLKEKKNRCRFPSRYLYLYRKGLLTEKESFNHCEGFQKFLKKINIDSVSVIFSSYYIDKPASAFGHTLFKINNNKRKGSDLSDYGVDFSAKVTTDNSLLYGILGVVGGFVGNFNLMPYFLKLREYNDYDSRDLWEFKLNLTSKEKEMFVAHLWDMNRAGFDYYYFSENCSYHVLAFLDAIVPRFKLIDKLGQFVTPIDTIIPMVESEGLVSEVFHRKSLVSRLKDQIKELEKDELEIVKKAFRGEDFKKGLEALGKKKQVSILDAAIKMIDYKHSDQIYLSEGEGVKEIQDKKRKVLVARSQIPLTTPVTNKIKIKNGVNISHGTGKAWIGYENSHKDINDRILLGSRFALHEYREPKGDLYGYFTLQMGRMEAAYLTQSKKLRLRRFEIANVEALRPVNFLNKKLSWNFSVGAKNNDVFKRELGAYIDLGLGAAFAWGPVMISGFLQTDAHKEVRGADRFSFDVGPRVVLSSTVTESLHLESSLYHVKNISSGNSFSTLSEFNIHYYKKSYGLKLKTTLWKSETRNSVFLTLFY